MREKLVGYVVGILTAVLVCMTAEARVGNQFEYSNEEADMLLTITSENPKEVELTEYRRKTEWPYKLTVPGFAIDEERDAKFLITSIGRGVFYSAPIREVEFPESIKSLGESCFYNTLLLGVDLRGIEEVGDCCFGFVGFEPGYDYAPNINYSGCLRYVVLGSSVKKLGSNIFGDQRLGVSMICYSSVPPEVDDPDSYRLTSVSIMVPVGSAGVYKQAQEEGKWIKGSQLVEFNEDILLCSGTPLNQKRYHTKDPYQFDGTASIDLIKYPIDQEIPCVVASTLCEVNNEFGPQPKPVETWSISSRGDISEEGTVTGIEAGSASAYCRLTLDNPEVTGMIKLDFLFYDPNSGVESIEDEVQSKPRFFDLNGREVSEDHLGQGVYIRVVNGRSEKIIRR